MDLRQLRTFQAVAEFGSLSKASDRLHLAEPALSRQIKLLEHDLKTQLFVRDGRGMVLTDGGRLLLKRIGGLVRQIEQVKDDLVSLSGTPSGSVALGIVPTAACVLAGRLAHRVAVELPNVSLRLVESYGGHLVDWMHRGEIDMAIIYGQHSGVHLVQEVLATDELMIVGPAGSRIAKRSGGKLAWLAGERLVLPSKSHGLRQLLERTARRRRLRLNVVIEADSFRSLVDIVERGVGYSVLPPSAIVREQAQLRLDAAPLSDPRVVRNLVLARSTDCHPSIAMEAVAALIRLEVAGVAADGLWNCAKTRQKSAFSANRAQSGI
jgi:LysR family nitrogen assimilation transcriptional regulator